MLRPDTPPGAGRLRGRPARPGRLAGFAGRRDRAVRPAAGPAARPVPVLALPARRARHRLPGGGGRHRPPWPGAVGSAGRRGARARHRGALPDRGRAAGARPGRVGDRPDGNQRRLPGRVGRRGAGLRRVRGRPRAGRLLPPARPVLAGRPPRQRRHRAAAGPAGRRGVVAHVRLLRLVRVPHPGVPGPVRGGLLRAQPFVRGRRRPAVRRRDRLRGARPAARAAQLPAAQPEPAGAAQLGHLRRGGPAGRPAERAARHAERLHLEPGQRRRSGPRLDQDRGQPGRPGQADRRGPGRAGRHPGRVQRGRPGRPRRPVRPVRRHADPARPQPPARHRDLAGHRRHDRRPAARRAGPGAPAGRPAGARAVCGRRGQPGLGPPDRARRRADRRPGVRPVGRRERRHAGRSELQAAQLQAAQLQAAPSGRPVSA